MKEFLHSIVYLLFHLVSKLPYRYMYGLSDFLFIMVYRVLRYRRSVVRHNITSSFPEKSPEECVRIEKGFYRWFCDYLLESVKLMSVSRADLLKHIEFRNVEEIEKHFDRGQTCAAILGHYCNWEILSATELVFRRHKEAVCGLIYHPLKSKLFDRMFIKIRQGMGGLCIPERDILRYLVSFRTQNLMNLFGYIADHEPDTCGNVRLRLPFLNHDTPVITGAERIMKKMGNAVFYVDMERPQRGKYICTFRLITDNPAGMPEFEITRRFFSMLEKTIRRAPEFYLWSHDRWGEGERTARDD